MDDASLPATTDVNRHIARRVRQLRTGRNITLEQLADVSGVSRSMISLIERGESSPTAVTLERLATGLCVTLASLFDSPRPAASPVSRRRDQTTWRDPDSGYTRRNVSPAGTSSPIRIVEVSFPAGGHVAYETAERANAAEQQVWVLRGKIDVSVGEERFSLASGDCLAFRLDHPISFHNPTRSPARYAVVICEHGRG